MWLSSLYCNAKGRQRANRDACVVRITAVYVPWRTAVYSCPSNVFHSFVGETALEDDAIALTFLLPSLPLLLYSNTCCIFCGAFVFLQRYSYTINNCFITFFLHHLSIYSPSMMGTYYSVQQMCCYTKGWYSATILHEYDNMTMYK